MSIAVVCRNGHSLKVKECCAGKTGRCPICRAIIEVPDPEADRLSDEDILDILGPYTPGAAGDSLDLKRASRPSLLDQLEAASPRKKVCEKCDAEIAVSSRICPHCRTYVTNWSGS